MLAWCMQVMEEIVQRTASAMVDRGIPFSGVLFAGLMIKNGKVCCSARVSQHCSLCMLPTLSFSEPEALKVVTVC